MNIILLGDPASGKATQAQKLVKKYGLFDLDMGQELRNYDARKKSRHINQVLRDTADIGKLAPTAIVRQIFKYRILNTPKTQGILLDGTPKMIGEAKFVYGLLKKVGRENDSILVLYLSLPFSESIQRARLRGRKDDTLASLRNRARYYKTQIAKVVRFFKSKYRFTRINALGSRPEVARRINAAIKDWQRQG